MLLLVDDRNSGPLASFPEHATAATTTTALSKYLQQVKTKFPEKTDATILLEPDTPYDAVVQVMDRVRVLEVNAGLNVVQYELFPDVSMGDAPVDSAGTSGGAAAPGAPLPVAPAVPADREASTTMSMSRRARLMLQHQLRHRAEGQLNLIPMIDILSVMVSFLLVYSTNVEVVQNSKGIEIPQSISERQPRQTVVVMLTKDEMFVQGERIAIGGRDPGDAGRPSSSRCAPR